MTTLSDHSQDGLVREGDTLMQFKGSRGQGEGEGELLSLSLINLAKEFLEI